MSLRERTRNAASVITNAAMMPNEAGTAERIVSGICGVLSFIVLVAWCRWRGTSEDQKKIEPAQSKKRERQKRNR